MTRNIETIRTSALVRFRREIGLSVTTMPARPQPSHRLYDAMHDVPMPWVIAAMAAKR